MQKYLLTISEKQTVRSFCFKIYFCTP